MLQEAVDKFLGGKRAQFGLTCVRRSEAKSRLVVLQLDQAAVADGYPENIRRQVFQGGAPIPHRLAVNDLILLPHFRRYLCEKDCLLQGLPEFAAKDFGESIHWQ